MVAVIAVPAAFFNWNEDAVTLDALIASFNVADTTAPRLIFVEPFAGATAETVGGVTSDPAVVLKTTSTK